MRAVVLGAAGFAGSAMCARLVALGYDVTAVVRHRADPRVARRLGAVLADMELIEGDACDRALLERHVPNADVVLPFAGHSGASKSNDVPVIDQRANLQAQLEVLEAARRLNRDARLVFPGSRLQYGHTGSRPVSEDHPQEPTCIYGIHKQTGEAYHRLYHEVHGIKTCALRISNIYGPGQNREDRQFGIVGTFVQLAAAGQVIPLFGGGLQLRDYLYIDDFVDVVVRCVTSAAAVGRVFNVGGPRRVSVREMAETVVRIVGHGSVEHAEWPAAAQAVETGDYVGNLNHVARVLGWQPSIDLDEGILKTLNAGASPVREAMQERQTPAPAPVRVRRR